MAMKRGVFRRSVEGPPAEWALLDLERAEARLVGHFRRIFDPVAEIDVVEPGGLHLADVIEDEQVAKSAMRHIRVVEAVDHGEPVGHDIGQGDGDKRAAGARAQPVFDEDRLHGRVLDHIFVVDEAHLRHAAAGMAGGEIAAEQRILLGGDARIADGHGDVGIDAQHAPETGGRLESVSDDADGLAGGAAFAGRTIDEVLAAPEAVVAQQVVERGGPAARKVREQLTLLPAGQVRARHGRGEEELGIVRRMFRHGRPAGNLATSLNARKPARNDLS
jgi:hypothetical protein